MEFSDLIKSRYSVRAYKPDPVPEDKLTRILEAGVIAPTAANRQAFRIMVVFTEGREEELRKIYKADWFVWAPVILAITALPDENWVRSDGHNYYDVDAAIVMDHLILAAANEGLGTCWIGAFNPAAARQVLKLPDNAEIVAFTPLGFPADSPKEKTRKSLKDLVIYGSWKE